MKDISPGWHTTIDGIPFFLGKGLSYLAIIMFLSYALIKILDIDRSKYVLPVNIINFIFCVLSTVYLGHYFLEIATMIYYDAHREIIPFMYRSSGGYFIVYMILTWISLLSTQLFWLRKNRVNINVALAVTFLFNFSFWIDLLIRST